jgi:cytochrome P450
MVSMQGGVGSQEHKGRKRDIGNVYAKSFLAGSDELHSIAASVLQRMNAALTKVITRTDGDGTIDVYPFNGAVNADFASLYLFGSEGATDFMTHMEKGQEFLGYQTTWLKGKPGHAEAQKWLENFGLRQCSDSASTLQDKEKHAGINSVVYKQLHARGLQGNDLASETLDHMIAGAEGPRTTLTYLQWELSKHPSLQSKLRTELSSLSSSPETGLPDFKDLDALPFLDAVLTETMRLYTLAGGPQYRITPPEGTTLDGYFIPGGTQVSASFAILHKNDDVFPEPENWDPERWCVDDKERVEEMRKWFWGFGKGSRVCVGKDFTMIGKLVF